MQDEALFDSALIPNNSTLPYICRSAKPANAVVYNYELCQKYVVIVQNHLPLMDYPIGIHEFRIN